MRRTLAICVVSILLLAFAFPMYAPGAERRGVSIGDWHRDVAGGFGDGPASSTAGPLIEYKGELYAGVTNENGAQVRVKNGRDWDIVNDPGFGDTGTRGIPRMEVFEGDLYAGTVNSNGCGVWRYDGQAWEDALAGTGPGFGNDKNVGVSAMETYGGKLYVGVTNYDFSDVWNPKSQGGEIWAFDGSTWTKVVGGGFGEKTNAGVTCLKGYKNVLYAGTTRFEISLSGLTKVKVTMTSLGCELYRKSGGGWSKVAGGGLGDTSNIALNSMEEYGGNLFMGTANGNGSVTIDLIEETISDYTYDTNGLFIYEYDGNQITEAVSNGFDSSDEYQVNSMCRFSMGGKDFLLAGIARTSSPGRLAVYNGEDWYSGANKGFGNDDNTQISGLAPYDDAVYVGTGNSEQGCEIWYGTPPEGVEELSRDWYLAEGSTNGGFETWVLIQNPTGSETHAQITYMTPGGEVTGPDVTLQPYSRQSINVAETVPDEWSVSTKVAADHPVIAERSMYWGGRTGGHDSIGVKNPAKTWYLAEGSTNGGFETWVLIQNPSAEQADVQLTYMTGEGEIPGPDIMLEPNTRTSIHVADVVPNEWSVSTKVTADQPVIAERSMYWNNRIGGHDSIGVTSPSSTWYLAEGSTNGGFETWVLLQNPGEYDAEAVLTFMTPVGEVPGPVVSLPPSSRQSINVAETVPGQWSVSTKVTANKQIIAERSMYWGDRIGGHDSIGATSPYGAWYLAEGSTNGGFETWVLIQNPSAEEVEAHVTFMTPQGEVPGPTVLLEPASRQSINVAETVPGEWSVSTRVTSEIPVIAERSMYWNSRIGGHDSIGAQL